MTWRYLTIVGQSLKSGTNIIYLFMTKSIIDYFASNVRLDGTIPMQCYSLSYPKSIDAIPSKIYFFVRMEERKKRRITAVIRMKIMFWQLSRRRVKVTESLTRALAVTQLLSRGLQVGMFWQIRLFTCISLSIWLILRGRWDFQEREVDRQDP